MKRGKSITSNRHFSSPSHTISPGDTVFYVDELLYGNGNISLADTNQIYGFPAGIYTIRMKRENEKIHLTSNELIVHIIEPEGQEKEALKLYTKMRYMFSNSERYSSQNIIKIGDQLIKKYLKSVYVKAALSLLTVVQKGTFDKYVVQLINKHPDGRMASSYIRHLMVNYEYYSQKEKTILKKLFQGVIKKHPSPLAAGEAKKQIKKFGSVYKVL